MEETTMQPREIAEKIMQILDSRKAYDLKLLYVEKQTILADYFIICSGTSNTQIRALAGEVEQKLTECGISARHLDGYTEATWIVMDYSSVIVHIFNREKRDFYKLEKLWTDAVEIDSSALKNIEETE